MVTLAHCEPVANRQIRCITVVKWRMTRDIRRVGRTPFIIVLIVLALCSAADAARPRSKTPRAPRPPEATCPREGTKAVTVARIADGDTFFATDGSEIDLAGVMAPGSGGERITPAQSAAARAALQAVLVPPVTIAAGTPDRYGRLKAQVFANGEWVQARLLTDGVVRAAPDLASAPCAPALLAIEKRAREAEAGHWDDGTFAVRAADSFRGMTGSYQIVEGAVVTAAVVKSRVYLNFGADWRSDFTASIAPEDKAAFRRVRVDWKALSGKHVRVRGWIEFYNGPMIALHAPGEIEFLDEMPKPQRAARARKPRTSDGDERERKPRKPRKPRKLRSGDAASN